MPPVTKPNRVTPDCALPRRSTSFPDQGSEYGLQILLLRRHAVASETSGASAQHMGPEVCDPFCGTFLGWSDRHRSHSYEGVAHTPPTSGVDSATKEIRERVHTT